MFDPTLEQIMTNALVERVRRGEHETDTWIEVSLRNGYRILFPCESVVIVQPRAH